jgi:hypothetical protein
LATAQVVDAPAPGVNSMSALNRMHII